MGSTLIDFFDSGNLFILFLTLTFFCTVQVFFFIEVVAQETTDIVGRQTRITTDIVSPSVPTENLRETVAELEASLPDLEAAAKSAKEKNMAKLYKSAKETFLLPIGIMVGLAVFFLLLSLARKNLHFPDAIAVLIVGFSFTTELILYVMVISNLDYVDDITVLFRTSAFFEGLKLPMLPSIRGA